ncbi:YdaU family protein [Kordiimonas sp.]|uniref:YdaU family protein n=1 Tax=Kordiimonas sp. TaxID=1970157 RepID=UPI003A8DC345
MAEFPALPLFTDAYLADTRHLTAEEHGAYLLLLMCAWRTRGCALKDCDQTLARTVGVTKLRWRKLRPTLAEFFTVADGLWRQKKLTEVYRGVEARVAKNRANGAKGGRARAAKGKNTLGGDCPETGPQSGPESGPQSGSGSGSGSGRQPQCDPYAVKGAAGCDLGASKGGGETLPTKTRIQNPKPAEASSDMPLATLAAAACLAEKDIDINVVRQWQAAGASVDADMVPTLMRIATREQTRTGRQPASLAYYTAAVLEARDRRLGAVAAGAVHAITHPPKPKKRPFNAQSVDDWRLFLGDATSRFRGDYLSQNWAISRENPHFEATSLGPNPRHSLNARIPEEVMDEYAAPWRWRRA